MGIVTLKGQSHAINLSPAVVDGYIELYFVDPQTGQIEPLDNNVRVGTTGMVDVVIGWVRAGITCPLTSVQQFAGVA
jgi:hypothetical protein